jgi:hypothetical protein
VRVRQKKPLFRRPGKKGKGQSVRVGRVGKNKETGFVRLFEAKRRFVRIGKDGKGVEPADVRENAEKRKKGAFKRKNAKTPGARSRLQAVNGQKSE